jgi:hypothetical protein
LIGFEGLLTGIAIKSRRLPFANHSRSGKECSSCDEDKVAAEQDSARERKKVRPADPIGKAVEASSDNLPF